MNRIESMFLGMFSASFLMVGLIASLYHFSLNRFMVTAFGADTLTIIAIITAPLFGLMVGGLLGGRIGDKLHGHLKIHYAICAILFALVVFGASAEVLISIIQNLVVHLDQIYSYIAIFLLFLVPSILIGMTLPVFTAGYNETTKHIGNSVGTLYRAFTLGAALGVVSVCYALFKDLDIQKIMLIANLLSGVLALQLLIYALVGARKNAQN